VVYRPSFLRSPWPAVLGGVIASLASATVARAEPSKLPPEFGWNYGEPETARSAALGGATRAIGPDIGGLYGNPANIAASRVYHLGAVAQIWPEAHRQSYGAAAVDSVTSRLAGGLGGSYTSQDPDGIKRKSTDIRFGLGFPLSEKILLGGTIKYLKLNQDGFGPFGSSLPSGGLATDPIVSGVSFDAGITAHPADILWLGLSGTNLNNPGDGFRPLGLGGGLGVGTRDFSIEGDAAANFTTYAKTRLRYMLGGEFLVGEHFPLRAGYRYDDALKSHAISGGLGYLDQQFGVEMSVRRTVSGEASTTVVLGLQYFLESTGLTKAPNDIDMP
jgi:opacity protein-like surface antigen